MGIWAEIQHEQRRTAGAVLRVPGRPQYGYRPIVTVFAGRRWVLDDDAQSLAFTVSNRSTYRHDTGGPAYGRYVLLLADVLGTDPTTAGRLARWICPDGCTVLRSGPRVAYVLTCEQERNRRGTRGRRNFVQRVNALRAGGGPYSVAMGGRDAARYRAEFGHNPEGPYICRSCGGMRVWGNGFDRDADGVRRSCGPRCPGPTGR